MARFLSLPGHPSEQHHPEEQLEVGPDDLVFTDGLTEEVELYADYGFVISIGKSCMRIHYLCTLNMDGHSDLGTTYDNTRKLLTN